MKKSKVAIKILNIFGVMLLALTLLLICEKYLNIVQQESLNFPNAILGIFLIITFSFCIMITKLTIKKTWKTSS